MTKEQIQELEIGDVVKSNKNDGHYLITAITEDGTRYAQEVYPVTNPKCWEKIHTVKTRNA